MDQNNNNAFNPTRQKLRVVLGGSFNPPTRAHAALLMHAMKQVGDGSGQMPVGMFVPSSHAYVSRKVNKIRHDAKIIFSEQQRVKMLENISNPMLEISDIELGDDGRGHTYDTLVKIKAQYPDDKIMFLAGADKLKIMPRWHEIEKLLSEFTILITARCEDDAEQTIRNDKLLSKYIHAFWIIPELGSDYSHMSSTSARNAANAGRHDALCSLCGYENAGYIRKLLRDAQPSAK